MAHSPSRKRGVSKVLAFSTWLYGLFIHAYPTTFRRTYGSRMVCVFRDSCRDALQRHNLASLVSLWLQTLSDLLLTACLERWSILKEKTRIMPTHNHSQNFPLRLWVAIAVTLLAFVVSLVASINLYLLEDASPLTQAAYVASPLLRLSYDGILSLRPGCWRRCLHHSSIYPDATCRPCSCRPHHCYIPSRLCRLRRAACS